MDMTITETKLDGIIHLAVEGRADAVTSQTLQNAILLAFQKGKTIVLDFEKLEYVSSSGLRALLIGQKTAQSKGGVMKLIHVQKAVMDVLKLSGFHNILTIE